MGYVQVQGNTMRELERHLRFCDPVEVKDTIRLATAMKSHHRTNRNGYSDDKTMRDIGMIPNAVYWNPAFKNIFHNPDPIEREKLRREFFKSFPKFSTVDKL